MKQIAKYLTGLCILFAGCGEDNFKPASDDADYFPVQVGNTWVYEVDETIYSEVASTKQSAYRLKVSIVDSVRNATGAFTYIINRSRQELDQNQWTSIDTWTVRKDSRELIVSEGNIPFIKLIFPAKEGLIWDGNTYNSLDEDRYAFVSVGQPRDVNGNTFENTLVVEQEFNDDFIVFLDERQEVYAKKVGLVSQSVKQLSYCTTEDCIGQQKIKSGRIYLQTLISYGKE